MTVALPYGIGIVFRHPERLWLAVIVALLLIVACYEAGQRKRMLRDPWIVLHKAVLIMPSFARRIAWWFFASIAFALMIACLAVPERKLTDTEKVYAGLRITFLFDDSLSMFYGEDVKPNRMRAAKDIVAAFVEMLGRDPDLKGRYSLAIIPFAGTAQPFFLTFTTSREEFFSALEEMNEHTVSRQGTSVLSALLAYRSLLKWYPPRETTTDVAIMLSDGGKEEGKQGEKKFFPAAINSIRDAIKENQADGKKTFLWDFVLYTVGIGRVDHDEKGRRIVKSTELIIRDSAGNFIDFYREDANNPQSHILTSQLDEEILLEVARLGGGTYYHFSDAKRITGAFRDVVRTHRHVADEISHPRYEPILHWFLVPAFVLWYVLFGFGDWIYLIIRAIACRITKKSRHSKHPD